MADKAEFERLLDVYGFRCERFGQDLSTHARAQVVSAFAALASAPVAGEAQGWSGWACQYPDKLPRLYGAREIAELNCDSENGDRLLILSEYAAPQASEAVRPDVDAVDLARAGMELHSEGMPEHTVCAELVRLADALKSQPQADKDGGQQRACTCHPNDRPAGDCQKQYAATDCQQHARNVEAAWAECRADIGTGGWTVSETINYHGFFLHGWRAALSATQTEQGERDA